MTFKSRETVPSIEDPAAGALDVCERLVREALFATDDGYDTIDWDLVADAYAVIASLARRSI